MFLELKALALCCESLAAESWDIANDNAAAIEGCFRKVFVMMRCARAGALELPG